MQRTQIPNVDALISFEAAARHGSFSRAADELHLTQGAVSRQIQKLEQQVGVILFQRVRQRVALTDVGKAYLADVNKILRDLDEATKRVRIHADLNKRLTVAAHPTVATFWLIPRLASFLRAHPQIDLNLKVRTESTNPAEQYDIAIQHGDPGLHGFRSEILFENRVMPVCSPEFKRTHGIADLADLAQVKLLHQTTRPEGWPRWFEQVGVDDGGKSRQGIWLERIPMIVQATMGSLGVALLPQFLIEHELKSGALIALSNRAKIVSDSYFLIHAVAAAEKTREFLDWIRQEAEMTKDAAKDEAVAELAGARGNGG